jgi:SAM-dependent methyltransferase
VHEAGHARLAWDLGANDGRFSRALDAETVVAVDEDERVVGELYAELRREGSRSILPLVVDLANPSPGLGWRGVERSRLEERGRPDLVLCLALVHHLAIGRNVPFAELVNWLRGLGARLVIEFAAREDPMVKRLLAAKRAETHEGYGRDEFERALAEAFELERREELGAGTRTLYLARPRG